MDFYTTNAETYAPFARLAYCERLVIKDLSCSFCENFEVEYATFFIHSIVRENDRHFQFIILFSDVKKEIVISFSGPTTEHGNFFTSIYSSGFVSIPELGGIRVETEYWEVYSENIREILAEKLEKIVTSGRNYRIVFIGHSFGGSLATLAAYDMVTQNIVIKTENSPLLFTYGQLRIGDSEFVEKVNKLVKVIKILRKDDYVTRMPNCVYIRGHYRCFKNMSKIAHKIPLIKKYISGYRLRKLIPRFKEKELATDPIVRGTTFVGGTLYRTHNSMFYSQPFGTELIYNGPNFKNPQACPYVNGIPTCETTLSLPHSFSADVHKMYYNMNIENC
jgi:hypothetical protein